MATRLLRSVSSSLDDPETSYLTRANTAPANPDPNPEFSAIFWGAPAGAERKGAFWRKRAGFPGESDDLGIVSVPDLRSPAAGFAFGLVARAAACKTAGRGGSPR